MTITTHPLRHLGAITLFLSLLLWSACGDTFRPVVIPIPPTPPDPRSAHIAFAITNNGNFNPGSIMLIDVSGDSTSGFGNVGIGPSHATLVPPSGSHIAVANQGDDTITLISTSAFGGGLTAPTTVTLSPQFNPVYVTSNENNVLYAASLGNTASAISPSVAVISTLSNAVTNVISLPAIAANSLITLVETPDARKVYVATQLGTATGAVTSINTVDKSAAPILDPTGILSVPIAAAARSDSARVYVLNQGNGNVAVIDSSTSPTADTLLPGTVSVGAGADFLLYDPRLNRLYVTNSGLATLSIFDATLDPPNLLATLSLPSGANPSCSIGCASVAASADGTRAYVTTLRQGGSNVAVQVTAINTTNNTILGTINLPGTTALANCVGARFRVSSAAAADSSRVFVAECDAGAIATIRTADNSLISLPAPVSAAEPVRVNITGASQTGSETTFNYSLVSGPGLQVGMSIVITLSGTPNIQQSFIVGSVGSGTFTVLNPPGESSGAFSATGLATPLQNPVFVLPGP